MQFDINAMVAFISLMISLVVCIIYIITAFRPKKPAATKEELDVFRTYIDERCIAKHSDVARNFNDLFNIDRARTREITDKLDGIRDQLSRWQQGIERQLGNHDGRLENLEDHKHKTP